MNRLDFLRSIAVVPFVGFLPSLGKGVDEDFPDVYPIVQVDTKSSWFGYGGFADLSVDYEEGQIHDPVILNDKWRLRGFHSGAGEYKYQFTGPPPESGELYWKLKFSPNHLDDVYSMRGCSQIHYNDSSIVREMARDDEWKKLIREAVYEAHMHQF